FSDENPIGKMIKCGPHWMKIIGVLDERLISKASIDNLGIRDYNMDVYAPVQTLLIRYKNRALLTEAMVKFEQARLQSGGGFEGDNRSATNYHQIDRLVIQVDKTESLNATADVISRILKRRHYDVID